MPENIAAQGGQAQINQFAISSTSGKSLDVSGGIIELNYYESILDTTIRVTATLADTGYRPNTNGENAISVQSKDIDGKFVDLKFTDGYETQLQLTGDKKLRVSRTRDVQESTNKSFYTIDLVSPEYHDNPKVKCAVTKRYDGQPDESVKKILTEDCIKTKKKVDVDPTLNTFNFTGKSQNPFYICMWCATRSVPNLSGANQKLAGYFFYENYDGYKFKSIDGLFGQEPKRKLIFNNLIGEIPPGYNGKILTYSFDKTFDLKTLQETGALGQSELRTFSLYGNEYQVSSFNYQNQYQESNTGGTKPIEYGTDQGETTKRFFKLKDYGALPSGSTSDQIKKSKDTLNYDVDDILRQSTMRYNSLYTVKLSVIIAADVNIRAGDLIYCDFPEVSGETLKVVNSEKGGYYLVHDLCHRITKNSSYTSLNLVRESIGRKPMKM